MAIRPGPDWHSAQTTRVIRRLGVGLLVVALLLGAAHLLWPDYRWGQGRRSYFNFVNSLTFASWLASMQLVGIAVLGLVGFHRQRRGLDVRDPRSAWVWLGLAGCALWLSFAEITRIHDRLDLLGPSETDVYSRLIVLCGFVMGLTLFGWFLLGRLRDQPVARCFVAGWIVAWGIARLVSFFLPEDLFEESMVPVVTLIGGLGYLAGCTLLLMAIAESVLGFPAQKAVGATPDPGRDFPQRQGWILIGVAGTTFTIIFLQVILFQMLTVFGDYMTATSVISIALLGLALGGLIGWQTASVAPLSTIVVASLLLPVSILLAFGVSVNLMHVPLLASVLLMVPFAASGTVVTVVLARARPHVVYCIDLVGAALGALLVSWALTQFREEGSLLLLAAFTCVLAVCFIAALPDRRVRYGLVAVTLAGAAVLVLFGRMNVDRDWLNIVRTKIQRSYPQAETLFSRSSFVGRYDVVRRRPGDSTLSTYDNGRIIDTVRQRSADTYQIDPRVPHTLMADPTILILGLSGDGITKTARSLGKKVYGVEINPAVVDLQTHELVEFNANSYENIDVTVMDARTYVEQSTGRYDMITLLNAHRARGRTAGRAASPEYLHTYEAFEAYLSRLTDRGVVIVEEPVSRVRREVPVWKLLATMRQVLLDHGSSEPERHFFIFQWRTSSNNYVQIVMKKNPLTDEEITNLRQWLQDVDNRTAIEAQVGRRLGPIRCRTTLLHSPDESLGTNCARIVWGEVDDDFLEARNLRPTTDDRPFHFDVDPARREFKKVYGRTLGLTLILVPFVIWFLRSCGSGMRGALPYVFVVALTGLGYLLVEVVLIQRIEIFLGSPVVTFSTVLGTMLLFSGLGSLWSGRIDRGVLCVALGGVIVMLVLHAWAFPMLLAQTASRALAARVAVVILAVAPLAFLMGVPFPFVLRMGKAQFRESAAALLFAINAAASALAVPLSINLSASHGFQATFHTAIALYAAIALLVVCLHRSAWQRPVNAAIGVLIGLLLASPWLGSRPGAGPGGAAGHWRVFAVNCGVSTYREDRIFQDGVAGQRRSFAWLFWVLQGEGRTILVDTGFDDPDLVRRWRIREHVPPVERLEALGIAPTDVTDVILTHAHWDHMGGLAPYTSATIWMQRAEYQHAVSVTTSRSHPASGVRQDDVERVLAAEREGRLILVDGQQELYPGITVTPGAGHTVGFQYVTVDTLDGPVIIAGDATYLYENNQWHRPIGSAVDHEANLAAIRQMHRRAASPFFIMPGHDPRVMTHFPPVADGVVQITAIPE